MDKLLLIDDEDDVRYSFKRIFSSPDLNLETAASGEEGIEVIRRFQPDLVLMDGRMGGINGLETLRRIRQDDAKLPVIMMTAYGTTQTAIEAMKLGAYDYLLKPFDVPKLKQIVADALKAARDMRQVVACEPLLESEDYDLGIVGRSQPMQEVFKMIGQLAGSDATALITGESGTGKELVARAIYHNSQRNDKPYLPINCAAIPENLLESELFGHEKGAFTGAVARRLGKFEEASGGTLLLDEISEMAPHLQAKLLRAIQEKEIDRVGGSKSIPVDVRIVATSNRNIEDEVAKGNFREDLYYRLNVINLKIPALSERPGDIPVLAENFVAKYAEANGMPALPITKEVLKMLAGYTWPGNVRELENTMHRAVLLATGDKIESKAIILGGIEAGSNGTQPAGDGEDASTAGLVGRTVADVERELIIETLHHCLGNRTHAATILGISIRTLRNKLKQYGESGFTVPTPGEAERPTA